MKIEIDTDDIIEQVKEEIADRIDGWICRLVEERVNSQVMIALNKQLDHIEKTPYNIIHHRLYVMLDKYIEKEIQARIEEQEWNDKRSET